VVHVDPNNIITINKHCRYCPDCDILIAHQDELEHMLVVSFEKRKPEVIGNDYLVIGTIDKSTWRKSKKETLMVNKMLEYLHDFKEYIEVGYRPASWGPVEDKPSDSEQTDATPIDDQNQVKVLMEKMEDHLPIQAEVLRSTANHLWAQGILIPPHRQVSIHKVFYSGDEGGITCAISPPESKEAIVISLTHLKIPYRHSLEKEIRAYQKARIKKLA
jgi:hypothetical protein